MALTTRERTELRQELVGQGYSWEYIDEWQPKVSLYRHRAQVSPSGEVVSKAGTKLENLPGNPDFVNRKARQGLFPWPPSDSCSCRWCATKSHEPKPETPPADTAEEPSKPVAVRGGRRMGRHFGQS